MNSFAIDTIDICTYIKMFLLIIFIDIDASLFESNKGGVGWKIENFIDWHDYDDNDADELENIKRKVIGIDATVVTFMCEVHVKLGEVWEVANDIQLILRTCSQLIVEDLLIP